MRLVGLKRICSPFVRQHNLAWWFEGIILCHGLPHVFRQSLHVDDAWARTLDLSLAYNPDVELFADSLAMRPLGRLADVGYGPVLISLQCLESLGKRAH